MTRVITEDDRVWIEREYSVNIGVSDASGCTRVYVYTGDGDCLSFELYSMNPEVEDVRAVAQAIDTLCRVSDKRPRVGKWNRT